MGEGVEGFTRDRKPLILVVDDEDVARQIYRDGLVSLGYEVIEARSAEDGIAMALERAPEIILMDLSMPGMDGIEATRELRRREETRRIPVIVITAHSGVIERLQALTAGADEFLPKPVYMSELRVRVRNVLRAKEYEEFLRKTNEILEDRVLERTAELRRAYDDLKEAELDVIRRLSRAAEIRDDETGRHIMRISFVVHIIARGLALPEETCEMLLYASPMHDVGKIGIPDAILLKPAKLNPEEWEIMKKHTIIGAHILKGPRPLDQMAERIALSHHEKWNGKGYPNGLKGEEIPICGRLVAIADVFDALVSRRVYKRPMPEPDALLILREEAGAHFDPTVVDCFFGCLDSIREVYRQYSDDETSRSFLRTLIEGRVPI
jgi:putative two-component system response regulator